MPEEVSFGEHFGRLKFQCVALKEIIDTFGERFYLYVGSA